MRPIPMLALSGIAALVAVPGIALAERVGAADVDRVQLAVFDSGGASCPRDAELTAWAHTNGPGSVRFVVHNSGGGKTGELKANAVAGAAGTYLATYRHTFKISADVDTKYMVEAVGTGITSNWVGFEALCGPQARAGTSASGASTAPPARTASESRARDSLGTPTSRGGEPPARSAPASSPETKPNSQGDSDGTTKPNPSSADRDGKCGSKISSTRYDAVTRDFGKMTALAGWMAAVVQEHPISWRDWANAEDKSLACTRSGALWKCTASARPCEP